MARWWGRLPVEAVAAAGRGKGPTEFTNQIRGPGQGWAGPSGVRSAAGRRLFARDEGI